jgi:hypothetical protein
MKILEVWLVSINVSEVLYAFSNEFDYRLMFFLSVATLLLQSTTVILLEIVDINL